MLNVLGGRVATDEGEKCQRKELHLTTVFSAQLRLYVKTAKSVSSRIVVYSPRSMRARPRDETQTLRRQSGVSEARVQRSRRSARLTTLLMVLVYHEFTKYAQETQASTIVVTSGSSTTRSVESSEMHESSYRDKSRVAFKAATYSCGFLIESDLRISRPPK